MGNTQVVLTFIDAWNHMDLDAEADTPVANGEVPSEPRAPHPDPLIWLAFGGQVI